MYLYAFFSVIVAVFLNPQQTKYFGGLAIEFKKIGFFIRYQTAENFVYWISWFFVILFFTFSFCLTRAFV